MLFFMQIYFIFLYGSEVSISLCQSFVVSSAFVFLLPFLLPQSLYLPFSVLVLSIIQIGPI